MSAGWVGGSVRARAMTRRRLGRAAARALAASPSLAAALSTLASAAPYGHTARTGQSLADAQREVVNAVLWNLRVLAGWMPREGATVLRVLVGSVEAANIDDHVQRLAGAQVPTPYRLGALATAWPRLARANSTEELRRVLATSAWGDPGSSSPHDIGLTVRATLADRTMSAVPSARAWAAGATALLVARQLTRCRRELPPSARRAVARVVGPVALSARTLPELATSLPADARWALDGVDEPTDLWQAEARWWVRVEREGDALARRPRPGPEVLVGTAAVMAADAWRVRAALELAARGGKPLEVFDAMA
jgi:hypothetical protein